MNLNRCLWILFALVLLAAGLQLVCYYPLLPERVATHFNLYGDPDGWSSKASLLQTHLLMLGLLVVLLSGLWLLLPRFPRSMINLPHKEYWLAPERSHYTIAVARNIVLGLNCLTLLFVTALMHLTMRANLAAHPRLGPNLWVISGIFLVLILGLSGGVIWFFRKPSGQM